MVADGVALTCRTYNVSCGVSAYLVEQAGVFCVFGDDFLIDNGVFVYYVPALCYGDGIINYKE